MGSYDNMNGELVRRIQQMINASGGRIKPGSGHRTVEQQIRLRKSNGCPDIWQSPASSCRVPTAIPGRSNHNHGLAMDLSYSGDGAEWAAQNAGRFGLHFPVRGENWHVEMIDDEGSREHMQNAQGAGAIGFNVEMMEQPNPEDELANRMHGILKIIGKDEMKVDRPMDLVGGTLDQSGEDLGTGFATETQMIGGGGVGGAGGAGGGQLPGGIEDPNGFAAMAMQYFDEYGWGPEELPALIELWNKESGDPRAGPNKVTWNPRADNPTSTAYGIAQFLNGTWEGTGVKRTDDPNRQIKAGSLYIAKRYKTPSEALAFHRRNNWY